jgi:probable phosphoglycerate mutase
MDLLLVRHAEPMRVVDAVGKADPHLHERGIAQAERLAAWLGEESLDGVWSSPLRRAIDTADPVARVHNLPITIDADLAEFDRNDNSYIPIEEMKATRDPRLQAIAEGRYEEFGMDYEAFSAGAINAMEDIIAANSGRKVAVICHGGVINLYLAHVIGMERRVFFEPAYTSISRVLAARSGQRSLQSLNEVAHLRNTGLLLA